MRAKLLAFGILTLVVVVTSTGCSTGPGIDETERQNMEIIRKSHADLQRGDIESFKAVISPNYVRHCQAMPPDLQKIHGTDKFFGFIEEFLVAVPAYRDSLKESERWNTGTHG